MCGSRNVLFFLGLLFLTAQASAVTVAERAKNFNEKFFPDGVPTDVINQFTKSSPSGVRYFKTVFPGVYYRGGGPGGMIPLKESGLKSLCEAGFSSAVYLYDGGGLQKSVSCTTASGAANKIDYYYIRFASDSGKTEMLKMIRDIAENPGKGPTFIHCWNGMHASGEIAAVALKQFCPNWGSSSAVNYWDNNHKGGVGQKGIDSTHGRIRGYSNSELKFSDAVQKDLCSGP